MITLASDFGSPYPAAMKGVILERTDARLVDVAHDLPRQDVRAAAFWLRETLPYFPPATHLAVIDPGVGTDRDALVIRAGEHVLVGPDNGVLVAPARALADDATLEAFAIDEGHDDAPAPKPSPGRTTRASSTFHGRDVFAPAAAVVEETPLVDLESIRWLVPADPVDLELPTAELDGDVARGEVLVVDDFGNVVTNVPGAILEGRERIVANGESVAVGETFESVPAGERLATVGSHGYVELDVNRGRGDEAFGLDSGAAVCLALSSDT